GPPAGLVDDRHPGGRVNRWFDRIGDERGTTTDHQGGGETEREPHDQPTHQSVPYQAVVAPRSPHRTGASPVAQASERGMSPQTGRATTAGAARTMRERGSSLPALGVCPAAG